MKKILSLYSPNMLGPIVRKSAARLAAGLVAALLWNRFINAGGTLSITRHAFFAVGFVIFCMAWFNYLALDGMKIHYLNEDRPKKKKTRRRTSAMADYTDEQPEPAQVLSRDQASAAALAAGVLSGGFFMLLSVLFMLF